MVGQTLEHYRIIERIGAGGMGEVYRAHDKQLDRDVALKVLPAGTLTDDTARKRLHKEALTLAKLNHPNIATVHELGTENGIDFLVMELVPGVALREKLRGGPLDEKEIRRLGAQLAEGLAAAHAQGVIHRDLKPANLQITPEGRLKILDFGLAKMQEPLTEIDKTLSAEDSRVVSGTLPYMSPEQLRGEKADARSDVYGAGTVLYEMATGQRPFPESHTARLIDSILHETPKRPATVYPKVAPALERIILRSLEKEPACRYQSARELLVALEGSSYEALTPVVRKWRMPGAIAIAFALLLVVVFGLNVGNLRGRFMTSFSTAKGPLHPSSALTSPRPSIAVLGFKNVSGRSDAAWLSTGLSEMLTTELAVDEKVRTVPEENVVRAKMDLSLPDADSLAKDTLASVRRNLGTDYVVLGSYVDLGKESGGQVRLDLRLQNAQTGETTSVVTETGTEGELFDLVSRAGTKLRSKLGLGEFSANEARGVRAALSSNPDAARLYAEGLAKLRVFDALAARDRLQQAAAADPKYPLTHSMLAEAWWSLGYDSKAREESKAALDLAVNLPREQQLLIEGRLQEFSKNWDKANETYHALWSFFPDNIEYGLRLATVQTSSGKAKDALDIISTMRTLRSQAANDPRLDIVQASALERLGDLQKAYEVEKQMEQKAQSLSSRLLLAQALRMEGWALYNLGRQDEAESAARESQRLYLAAGDRDGAARASNILGLVFYGRGDLERAKAAQMQCLAINREIGYQRGIRQALNNLGIVLLAEGEYPRTRAALQESLAIARAIGDRFGEQVAIGNLGIVAQQEGEIAGAKRLYEQQLAITHEFGNKSYESNALSGLGDTSFMAGDLAGARKSYEDALALRNQVSAASSAAEARVSLAAVLIEQGDPSAAEELCRRARQEFQKEGQHDEEIFADATLIRALLAQNKFSEAQTESDSSKGLWTKSQDFWNRSNLAIASARTELVMGKTVEAQRNLEGILAKATEKHCLPYQFEARLALGELKMNAGETAAGRALLASLEKDAAAKGFLLIANKAHAASAGRKADAKKPA
jgi:eukaryotic-like serine/threonine-protein kinase